MAKLNAGDKAPAFKAKATGNREVSLEDFKGKQNVLLFFYPAAFTPV